MPVIPRLVHPVKVQLQNANLLNANVNRFSGEVEGMLEYEPAFEIDAQVKFFSHNETEVQLGGIQLKGDGHIIVYAKDAVDIKQGTKIVSIEQRECEYYVLDVIPTAHYQVSGLRKVIFESKSEGSV